MYICICNAVTDTDIRRAADEGVSNMKQLKLKTGCASTCGKCIESAKEVLETALEGKQPFLRIVSGSSS
jgi:bacterioferritin-associated ferredoxin